MSRTRQTELIDDGAKRGRGPLPFPDGLIRVFIRCLPESGDSESQWPMETLLSSIHAGIVDDRLLIPLLHLDRPAAETRWGIESRRA